VLSVHRVHPALQPLAGGLVVSVQAEVGEPLYPPPVIEALCQSVLQGGAVGLRLANVSVIQRLRQQYPHLLVMGLHKPEPLPPSPLGQVYITATVPQALALVQAGANAVAFDATGRCRDGGQSLPAFVAALKEALPAEVALVADVATVDEGVAAAQLGVHAVSSTLAGYTTATAARVLSPYTPDWEVLEGLLLQVQGALGVPVIAEGRFWEPADVQRAWRLGAHAVVVGSALTRPHHGVRRLLACG
jgi:N-acylglucosamine-6-phosphate 2-epimerase